MRRFLRLAQNIALSNLGELKSPYRFTYILTYRCQFKCNMCNIGKRLPADELSIEQIRAFFAKSNKFSWVNLSGGEIFLRNDLEEILDSLFKNCRTLYLLDFPTNGFATERIIETVKKIIAYYKPPRLIVTVSIDGPPAMHDAIRNTPGSWEKAVETFRRLRVLQNRNFRVFAGMTLQEVNLDKFRETFISVGERVSGLGYADFHVNLAQRSAHYYGNDDFKPLAEDAAGKLEKIIRLRKRRPWDAVSFLEKRYQYWARDYLSKGSVPVRCQALSASFFMDPLGGIYPCSMYDKRIGSIADYDYDIYKLWDVYARRDLRREIINGGCPRCWTPCEAYQSILADLLPRRRH